MVRLRRIKMILAILILWAIPPVAGPFIQHCIILSEPEATIPLFHHSNRTTLSLDSEALEGRLSTGCERSELNSVFDTAELFVEIIYPMSALLTVYL